jgi:hypothetical protein
MDVIKTLNDFIEMALRNRKYASNSAYGYKAALRVFDEELSSEERGSIELFKERFDQIFTNIVAKNKKDFNISSLQVYKFRVLKVLGDYEKYGVDASKMAGWAGNVKKVHVSKNKVNDVLHQDRQVQMVDASVPDSSSEYNRHEISLRPSKRIVFIYPSDFTLKEAKSIKSFGEYLVSGFDEDHT